MNITVPLRGKNACDLLVKKSHQKICSQRCSGNDPLSGVSPSIFPRIPSETTRRCGSLAFGKFYNTNIKRFGFAVCRD
ncbi:MAG: hypothetical protein BGO12_01405 [Verrucomicrobia bacterium 61-8]|nr:MAG: hypothetical protein BGO12_01405 [Verrucomicrobia bacterium 61-8]